MFATKGRRLLLLGGVAVVVLASASVMMMRSGSGPEPQADAAPASRAVAPAKGQAGAPNALAAKPGAGHETATTPATTAPQVPAEGSASAESSEDASVFQRSKYTYRSLGRVDPFDSLVSKKDASSRLFAEKLDPEMLTLVGVLTNEGERRALVEDVHGFGYVLKEGDRVLRGRVISIGEESMKIRHTMYGVTETTTLSLVRKSQGRGLPNDRLR